MREAVLQTVADMTEAFERGDIDAVLDFYTDDAAVAFEPGDAVTGRAALRAGFEAFAAMRPKFVYDRGHEVQIAGDTAIHIAPWTMTGTDADGTPITEHGMSVAVLRHRSGNTWRIAIDNPYGDRLLT